MNTNKQEKNAHLMPMNLAKYKKLLLFVDTETIGDLNKGEKALPYDVSYVVFDCTKARAKAQETNDINEIIEAGIIDKLSMINQEIFDNKYLMDNAFYKSKIPFYKAMLKQNPNEYVKMHDSEILEHLNEVIKKYKTSTMGAYNSEFDYTAINNLYEIVPQVKNHFKKVYQLDLWNIALKVFERNQNYKEFCQKYNFISESGKNYLTNAETVYKFIMNRPRFIEHHTGLRDIIIELTFYIKVSPYIKGYQLDSKIDKKVFWKGGAFNVQEVGA